jgi:hypothetical protein
MYPVRFRSLWSGSAAVAACGAVALAVLTSACGSTGGASSATATRMAGTGSASAATVSAAPATSAPAGAAATGTAVPSAAAGGTPAASGPAGTAKLTGTAASALAAKALANTENSASVRVAGHAVSAGTGSQPVTFDLTLVKDNGCQGTIALSKTETFRIVETGGYVWMLPSSAYYSSLHVSKAVMALVADKYIRVKSTDGQIGDLAKICSFSGLFGSLPKTTGTSYVATPGTYHGAPAYQVTQAGNKGTAYISDTAKPLMLAITAPQSGGGAITFTNYNAVVAITPPSDAESIDGTQLGI